MISYVLIAGIAYGIAYWISLTGMAIWRAVVGFLIALVVGWLGGTLVSVFLISTFLAHDTAATTFNLLGQGFWLATAGAGIGVYRARYKLRTGQNAPALRIPKWIAFSALALFVIGIVAAVALPAYHDYTKRTKNVEGVAATNAANNPASQVDWDKFVITPPNQSATPEFVPPTRTLDLSEFQTPPPKQQATQPNPFEATQAIADAAAPKSQSADEQEHLRRIYAAHPDADAIHDSAGFKAWVAKYPAYQRILSKGSTQEIIEMFTAYKNQR
jgi:hypothetical protein